MRTDGINSFRYGRGDIGRSPAFSQTDVLVQQRVPIRGRRALLRIGANIINLFDQSAMTAIVATPYRSAFGIPDRQFFAGFNPVEVAAAAGNRPDPRYRMPSMFQTRRAITLQCRLTF